MPGRRPAVPASTPLRAHNPTPRRLGAARVWTFERIDIIAIQHDPSGHRLEPDGSFRVPGRRPQCGFHSASRTQPDSSPLGGRLESGRFSELASSLYSTTLPSINWTRQGLSVSPGDGRQGVSVCGDMAYCKAGTGAISIGFHGGIKKRLSRVEGKAVFACQSLFRADAAMRRRFLYACELSAGAAAVLAGFSSGTGACARGRSGGGAMRFYCGVSAKAMGKPFMHGKGLPLTPTPHRHSGTRKDLTGSDMRRPHCGWPVRSGCISMISTRANVQTRAGAESG